MVYRVAADATVLAHLGFVLFVVLGGLLVLRRPALAWLHLPVALYGAAIELIGWVCPLTPLENHVRRLAGSAGDEGGFIDHYAGLLLYPANWHAIKGYLAAAVVLINLAVYAIVLWRLRRKRAADGRRAG